MLKFIKSKLLSRTQLKNIKEELTLCIERYSLVIENSKHCNDEDILYRYLKGQGIHHGVCFFMIECSLHRRNFSFYEHQYWINRHKVDGVGYWMRTPISIYGEFSIYGRSSEVSQETMEKMVDVLKERLKILQRELRHHQFWGIFAKWKSIKR